MNGDAHPMRLAPRCGARARTRGGAPCLGPAMPNGRCRMHGGASTGARQPRMKHGGRSRGMQELLRLARRLLREAEDALEHDAKAAAAAAPGSAS